MVFILNFQGRIKPLNDEFIHTKHLQWTLPCLYKYCCGHPKRCRFLGKPTRHNALQQRNISTLTSDIPKIDRSFVNSILSQLDENSHSSSDRTANLSVSIGKEATININDKYHSQVLDNSLSESFQTAPSVSIVPGDYVVHMKVGVGIFKGTEYKSKDNSIYREYFVIQYKDGRLNVPVEKANEISRFRSREAVAAERLRPPRLDSLTKRNNWEKRKTKAFSSVRKLAVDLLKLYAIRAEQKRPVYAHDDALQREFQKSFSFRLTPDQLRCIQDIQKDMCERETPMDRLICGDVGFGKTEVAMHAIFRAFRTGKQVAWISPTTVLASQHYRTIQKRMERFGVRIGLLTRHYPKTKSERKELLEKITLGQIDVVIGTQSLLSTKLSFCRLSLLVIDEEQWLGVNQKERLKTIATGIDVLTLSATPIPRTLHMSLSNIRDMSLILTPPLGRLPVKNYVLPYNDSFIETSIRNELVRGGQVYIVCPRIADMDFIAKQFLTAFPNTKVLYANGTMKDVEDRILSFSCHEYDVLISTCIIEAGVDIPDANTIVVYRATSFGLSQLYQIRGRVGRSSVQAFAIFTFDPNLEMTEEAKERLEALKQFTSLGSGYEIANRDLEIRGPGSIIGSEQSGEVGSVGFEMYMNLLRNTLDRLRGKMIPVVEDCEIDIPLAAYIPDSYIQIESERMAAYRTLGQASSLKELEWLEYGEYSEAVACLLLITRLKLCARKVGMTFIRVTEDFVEWMVQMEKITWDCLCANVYQSVSNTICKDILQSFYLVEEQTKKDEKDNIVGVSCHLRSSTNILQSEPTCKTFEALQQVLDMLAKVAEQWHQPVIMWHVWTGRLSRPFYFRPSYFQKYIAQFTQLNKWEGDSTAKETVKPASTLFAAPQVDSERVKPETLFRLGKLNHIAVAVKDVQDAAVLYDEVFGADVSKPVPHPEMGATVIFVRLGNTNIELMEPLGKESPIEKFLSHSKAGGIHHICLEVPSISSTIERLKMYHIDVQTDKPFLNDHGKLSIFVSPKDSNGVLLELMEEKRRS
eukprot:jgi/Galph1/4179/GphlegSOOS_G2863.1